MAEAGLIGRGKAARAGSGVAVLRLLAVIFIVALWEAVAASGLLYRDVVPSILAIAAALTRLLVSADFYRNLSWTGFEVLASLLIGAPLGMAAGLALGANRFLGRALEPYLHYLAPAPKIVFLPALLVLFGVGPASKVAMGALSCFFPIALSLAAGVRQVDPVLLRVGRSFNLSGGQMLWKIYLPALLSPLATGLRLGLGVAIIGCLLAEIKLSNRGLGFLVMQYYAQFRVPEIYAILIVIFILAAAGNALTVRLLSRRGRARSPVISPARSAAPSDRISRRSPRG